MRSSIFLCTWRLFSLACFAILVVFAQSLYAVTVFDLKTKEQVRGYLISIDERSVTIDELMPDGSLRRRSFDRTKVDVTQWVNRERLERLTPAEPAGYKEYADELSEAKADPDARRTALRLYLIAAYLDPENLGRGSMMAMTGLATDSEEERRYRAMAYLLDPTHATSLLETPTPRVTTVPASTGNEDVLREGLRLFWTGRKSAAAKFAQREDFKQALAGHAATLSWEEFHDGTESFGESLPPDVMRKVVSLVLQLEGRRAEVKSPADEVAASSSWSQADWRHQARLATLTFQGLTPFDPRANRYRGGEWVAQE